MLVDKVNTVSRVTVIRAKIKGHVNGKYRVEASILLIDDKKDQCQKIDTEAFVFFIGKVDVDKYILNYASSFINVPRGGLTSTRWGFVR